MATVFTEAQRASLQMLTESLIDERWVKGIRAGWKALRAQTKKYEGRVSKVPNMDREHVQAAAFYATKSLNNVQRYIQLLRDDLLVNKGFWDLPSPKGEKSGILQRYRLKVVDELDTAEEAISDALSKVEHMRSGMAEVGLFGHTGQFYHDARSSQERFNWYLNSFGVLVDEAMGATDKAISGRLLRHISKLLAKSFKHVREYPTTGGKPRYVKKEVPLDFPEIPPPVVRIGKAMLIFQDRTAGKHMPSPRRIGTRDVHGNINLKPGRSSFIDPRRRQEFIKGLQDAQARLRAKGLGKLFVGEFHVYSKVLSPVNPNGAQWGMGGGYYRKGDFIVIYDSLKAHAVPFLVIHEVGHRYWYKHMSRQDRINFSKWFGDVSAVSGYGGVNPAEDFAEVFAYYVMGAKLTKVQHDRFRQFMTGYRPRVEALEDSMATKAQKCHYCDESAVQSLIWDDGRAYIPTCKAHDQAARNDVRERRDSVNDVVVVRSNPFGEGNFSAHPLRRMDSAFEPVPDIFYLSGEPGEHFGRRVNPTRLASALEEAPAKPPPRAPIGRRDIPRGAVVKTRTGRDIMGVTSRAIKRTSGEPRERKSTRKVMLRDRTRQEIPDSLLQMLGTDWKTLRGVRVHDNRITITIDGVRYSVYTRRG